jgi:lipopolysaccharide biosynthesis regulator YciM
MQPTISFEVWVIILLFGTILVMAFYSVYARKKVTRDKDNPYVMALKFMAEGENRLAVEKFKEAVRDNSSNIDAYLKLGTILRNEGLYKNAIRIHQDLTLRGDLGQGELIDVKKNLILDYWYLRDYSKAEYYLNQLKDDKSLVDWATPYLVKILEKKGEWQQAIEILNKSSLSREQKGKFKIAGLKVKQGQKLAENQEEKDARILFKEAIKTDQECAEGYLQLGDSYLREGRATDAIKAWTDLCKKVPENAHIAFNRLEKAWFEKGQFSKIEELYTSMLQEDEDNLPAIIALSEIYRKKGDYDQSLKLLQGAQKRDLESDLIQSQIAKVRLDKGQFKEAATLALELLTKENQIEGSKST